MRKLSILLILIIATLLAVTTPVSAAALNLHVDLGKTYKTHLMNISYIDAIDIWDLSQSQSDILSTVGDNSDIQTLHNPTFRYLTRTFTPTTGHAGSVSVTVNGDNPSTVDWTTLPAEKFYILPEVPTIQQKIPGMTGNPLVTKYNESWNTGSAANEGLFLASSGMNMYNTSGIMRIDTTDPSDIQYYFVGQFSASDVVPNNFTATLDKNKIPVDNFASSASQSRLLGNAHPEAKAGTGAYFTSTIRHNEATKTTNVYSVSRIVALKASTPMVWQNNTAAYTANEFTYFKGSNQNVVLNFTDTNPDVNNIKNITYLIINRTATYDISMDVDTDKLAENADSQWQNSLSSGQVIDILYKTLNNDAGLPYNYTMSAAGVTAAPSKAHSNIAITNGYGISGNAEAVTGRTITVPSAALESLVTGYYDIYLMGTNSNNNVVALDQKTVRVVQKPPLTVTHITPTFGHLGTTVSATITGTGFSDGLLVRLTRAGQLPIIATDIVVVSPTEITCNFNITPTTAIGLRNVRVFSSSQNALKLAAFWVKTVSPPTVTSITPASGNRGTTVSITNLVGTGFKKSGNYQPTVQLINGTTTLTAINVTTTGSTKIACKFALPANATVGVWNVKVTNPDNQAGTALKAFTVKTFAVPTVTSITPASGTHGTTVTITNLAGTQFAAGAKVQLTRTGSTTITATNVVVVSATKITCKFPIPAGATHGAWNVKVTNQDSQVATKTNAFTVN